jgi:hypothetical protein
MADTTSSPFKSPTSPASREKKRRRTETPDQPSSSQVVPQQTPRTAARYGISNEDVLKITKRAGNFKDLMSTVSEMVVWGLENPEYTDIEMGRQLVDVIHAINVPTLIYLYFR